MNTIKTLTFIIVLLLCNYIFSQTSRDHQVGSFETTITFNGEPSNVAYYVPLDYNHDSSYKLIVGLHYCTGSSGYYSYRNLLKPLSDSLNAIIMCPDCHNPGYPYTIPDSSIINKSTDSVIALYNINENYMYLTGGSCNGKTTVKYGLEYIHNYRGILSFNPYIPSIQPDYYDFDSEMVTVLISGTLDPSYYNTSRIYDSITAHQGYTKFIPIPGVGHDFWIPEFNIEMMNGIHFIDSVMDILTSTKHIYKEKATIKAYPNPFNNETNVKIELPDANNDVKIFLYDIFGNRIKVIFDGRITSSSDTFKIQIEEKGTFIIKLISGNKIYHKKIISI